MDQNAKQQVVERLKNASNVLVTVSTNPTVDQLAGAIALALMINGMGKHATAVFSGQIPDTMQFLDPKRTLETTIDSLRDFIISLDKSKADKLRYKVEDNLVKIFITPYRTRISEADLQFSQGDFNVDVVMALGVQQKEQLDRIIVDHGKILHDAAIVSVNSGSTIGDLGSINWSDSAASSLCEMLMSISEALQPGLIDEQTATALLTGIVSETNRFSNDKTTPKVMTMAAQLMAAGANQQLIATNLHPIIQGASAVDPTQLPQTPPAGENRDPSLMMINHPTEQAPPQPLPPPPPPVPQAPSQPEPMPEPEPDLPKGHYVAEEQQDKTNNPPPPAFNSSPGDAYFTQMPPGPIASMIHDTKQFAQTDEQVSASSPMSPTVQRDQAPTTGQTPYRTPQSPFAPKDDFADPLSTLPPTPPASVIPPQPAPISQEPVPEPYNPPHPLDIVGEQDTVHNAQIHDDETLAGIDAAQRGADKQPEPDEPIGALDIESARKAVEQAMGAANVTSDDTEPALPGVPLPDTQSPFASEPIVPSAPPVSPPPPGPPPFLNGSSPAAPPTFGPPSAAPGSADQAPEDFKLPPAQ